MGGKRRIGKLQALPYGDPANDPRRHAPWTAETRPERPNLRHGVLSPSIIDAEAVGIVEELVDLAPWLLGIDGAALMEVGRAKARVDRLDRYFAEKDDGTIAGLESIPRHLLELRTREATFLLAAFSKLGMTPVDRATLMKDNSWAMALSGGRAQTLATEGARLRALRRGQ